MTYSAYAELTASVCGAPRSDARAPGVSAPTRALNMNESPVCRTGLSFARRAARRKTARYVQRMHLPSAADWYIIQNPSPSGFRESSGSHTPASASSSGGGTVRTPGTP